jgi:hemoglobin
VTVYPEPAPKGLHPWGDAATPFDELGGETMVRRLVDSFYDRIRDDSPQLRAMHPTDDRNSRRNLFEFLCGWLGGPPLYAERRGHPRLRMRHLPFSIGEAETEEWMRCMRGALDDIEVADPLRAFLESRLGQTAHHLRNAPS